MNPSAEQTKKNGSRLPYPTILRFLSVGFLLFLIYVLWGTLQFPRWWYGVFYEGDYKKLGNFVEGAFDVLRIYHVPIIQTVLIVITILAFSRTRAPRTINRKLNYFWRRGATSWMSLAVGIILLLSIIVSVNTLESRTSKERELERQLQETDKILKETRASSEALLELGKKQIPLSVPTSFIYLDKDSIDSLFGQYEPELVPAIMQEEIEQSMEISGGIHSSFITTDAGQKELNKRITEYRTTPKNSERKLKDLIRYLNDKALLPMFRDVQPKSEELGRLDEATQLLSQRYGISTDNDKLKIARDRLLAEELRFVEHQLSNLRGLTLVEGEWSVENQPDAFIFRHSFVENVSNSPVCEIKLSKKGVNGQYKEVLETTGDKPIRLTAFGNVLIGLTENSRTISLNATAIF